MDIAFKSSDVFARCAALTVGAFAGVVLLGWALDLPALKSVIPDNVPVKPNTAIALVLAAFSLGYLTNQSPPRPMRLLARAGALVVSLIGLATLTEDVFGWNLGIDDLVFGLPATTPPTYMPGRMAPHTALGFVFIGAALLMLHWRSNRLLAKILAVATGVIALLTLTGYIYSIEPLYRIGAHYRTALAFLLMSGGILKSPNRSLPIRHSNQLRDSPAVCAPTVNEPAFVISPAAPRDIFLVLSEVANGAAVGHFSNKLANPISADAKMLAWRCAKAILAGRSEVQDLGEHLQFVVARVGTQTVGAVLASSTQQGANKILTIETLVVADGFRRQGVGEALVRHFTGDNSNGAAVVLADCTPQSQSMQRLLRRLGFTRVHGPQHIANADESFLAPSLWSWQRSRQKPLASGQQGPTGMPRSRRRSRRLQ